MAWESVVVKWLGPPRTPPNLGGRVNVLRCPELTCLYAADEIPQKITGQVLRGCQKVMFRGLEYVVADRLLDRHVLRSARGVYVRQRLDAGSGIV